MKISLNIGLALTAAIGLALTSCKTANVSIDSSAASGIRRTVYLTFEGDFTKEERKAVVQGANMSKGTKLYGVQFAEYKGSGKPSSSYVRVSWFEARLQHQIPGWHGSQVHGFYAPGELYKLISINDTWRGSPRAIREIVHHEADHAFGRDHLPKDQKRKMELLRGGNPIPPSQDWTVWPKEPSI